MPAFMYKGGADHTLQHIILFIQRRAHTAERRILFTFKNRVLYGRKIFFKLFEVIAKIILQMH
ncbi:hypothetical protein SDC9_146271 [bioreactor metagenome]|uniref:Uncharacterized protein n=1 Tax=bioreactor metagenome TaxID=1076179 RepID=A0A645ECK9_9ZZZZ